LEVFKGLEVEEIRDGRVWEILPLLPAADIMVVQVIRGSIHAGSSHIYPRCSELGFQT
jgi:hypothetical protein